MRLTVKLRDGSKLVTAHADLEGEPTQDLCDLTLAIASQALTEGAAAIDAFAAHQEKRKTSRLGAGVRGRTAIRDPLPDIE